MIDERTLRAYRADWNDFEAWAGRRGFHALPAAPQAVALYLRAKADEGMRLSTIRRRLSAIAWRHRNAALPTPTTDDLVRGALQEATQLSAAFSETRLPVKLPELRRLLAALPNSLVGVRDRAVISLAFAAALRRSDLVRLDIDQIQISSGRLVIASKGGVPASQITLPRHETVTLCPVRAVNAWASTSGSDLGPLFRPIDRHGNVLSSRLSDRAVGLIVARAAGDAGLEAARISPDSLRLGGQAMQALGLSLDDLAESA